MPPRYSVGLLFLFNPAPFCFTFFSSPNNAEQNTDTICSAFSTLLKKVEQNTQMEPAPTRLLPRLRDFFGLSLTEAGHCLGLSKTMLHQVERGLRPLPLQASLPQAALTLAYHNTPAEPEPETPDTAALHQQQRAAELRANQLTHELSQLPARAVWARRRLAALPGLTAALAPAGTAPPVWLAGFTAEAHAELARSGSTEQARLRGRITGLRAEAAALAQELAALEQQ